MSRLNRTEYRAILALVEQEIHIIKDRLHPPAEADWGLTDSEYREHKLTLDLLQRIHRKLCHRAYPADQHHCSQRTIKHLVESTKPYRYLNELEADITTLEDSGLAGLAKCLLRWPTQNNPLTAVTLSISPSMRSPASSKT